MFSSDNFYYPYFEENPTWKLFPVNYKTLVEKNNYNDYDFIVISDLYQMTDAYKKSEVEFNYVLKDKKPVFIDETKPKILYINENAEYITSGKTFASFNLIDLEKMPDNFKLVKKIELNRNTKGSKDPRSRNSYIFKQIY
ncbi:MAG: hypothetical protein MZV70_76740 [Desulfobacterales bacterium]|nr:hypothetical protein [Desulfobacterales bacterium]